MTMDSVLAPPQQPAAALYPPDDDQLVDNLLTFLLAGHETTAKALTWALYLVARARDGRVPAAAHAA